VKGLNIKPIRDELQALKNVRDFCCLKWKFPGSAELVPKWIFIYELINLGNGVYGNANRPWGIAEFVFRYCYNFQCVYA
jgi:hypothetical protein